MHRIGAFDLEDGGAIPDLELAYANYGELNEAEDNAICIPTWFSGTPSDLGARLHRPGSRA